MRACITVLLILTCLTNRAQGPDYSWKLDKALGLAAKMDIYVSWAYSLEPDWDSAIVIAGQARQYAREQHAPVSELDALAMLYDLHYRKDDSLQAIRFFNEALQLATGKQLPGSVLDLYYFAAEVQHRRKNDTAARAWYEKGYALARQLKRKDYQFQYFNDLGLISGEEGQPAKAEAFYKEALRYARTQKDTFRMHVALNNLAGSYSSQNKYEESVASYLESLRLKEQQHDEAHMLPTLGNLAHVYTTWGKSDLAGHYAGRALQLGRRSKDKATLLDAIVIYCDYLEDVGKLEELKRLAEEGLALSNQLSGVTGTRKQSGDLRKLLGDAAFEQDKDYDRAAACYQAALNDWKSANFLRGQAILYKSIARLALARKQAAKALRYLDSGAAVTDRIQDIELAALNHKAYSEAYELQGNASLALKHFKQFHILHDSLYRQETHRQVAELETRYQTGKKEQTITAMQQERRLRDQELKRTRLRQALALAAAGVIALLLFISIRTNRKVRRQQALLARQNEVLTTLNQVRTRLFSIISHDLRGLVVPLQQAGKLMQHQVKKEQYDKATGTAFGLQENAERLSGMLDNLLHWSATQLNGYVPHPGPVDPARELQALLETFLPLASLRQINLIRELPEGLQLVTDKGGFLLICRNLVANALQYTPAGGTVTVSLEAAKDGIGITIADTGPGMPAGIGAGLDAAADYRQENKDSKGLGLGLELVRQFTRLNQGQIFMDSAPGKGTRITVRFPLNPLTTKHEG